MSIDCPILNVNIEGCNCTNENCERTGLCCECVRNHKAKGNLPACLRPAA